MNHTRIRTVVLSEHSRKKTLRVEAPGCIVNIYSDLTDLDGRKVTNVSVSADGDSYHSDEQWWCPDLKDPTGIEIRVVQTDKKPAIVYSEAEVLMANLLEWSTGNRGRRDVNPYGVDEVLAVLRYFAKRARITDPYSVNVKKIAGGAQ